VTVEWPFDQDSEAPGNWVHTTSDTVRMAVDKSSPSGMLLI
jgi:hypothetical protein